LGFLGFLKPNSTALVKPRQSPGKHSPDGAYSACTTSS